MHSSVLLSLGRPSTPHPRYILMETSSMLDLIIPFSVGSNEGIHYCSNYQGTVEIAIKDEHDKLVNLSAYDQVEGYLPMSKVEDFIHVLETRQDAWACHKFFHHYFEPVQIG